MKMEFEEMEPIFGQLKAEWSAAPKTIGLGPFLYLVGGLLNDPAVLRICVTDFHSNTWESRKSKTQLEDMKDSIGIGGSWSDFVEYVIASIKSEDVKLIMEGESKSGGAANAKLIAQKAKGMPRISISLVKLLDADANEAMANMSLELYKAYKNMHISLMNGEKRCCQLTKILSAEQEKNEALQKQLDTMTFSKKQKFQKINDKTTSDGVLMMPLQDSPGIKVLQWTGCLNCMAPDQGGGCLIVIWYHIETILSIFLIVHEVARISWKAISTRKAKLILLVWQRKGNPVHRSSNMQYKQGALVPASTKVTNRVVPTYRRAKVRGVLLQDSEDNA